MPKVNQPLHPSPEHVTRAAAESSTDRQSQELPPSTATASSPRLKGSVDSQSLRSANGKAERFIKILLEEWAYVMPYGSFAARNDPLPAYLRIYNGHRCHMALRGLTPQQRLDQLQA